MTLPMPTDKNVHAATLNYVHDGDTPIMRVELTPTLFYEGRCRMARCNCPELTTPEGQTALAFAQAWFAGGTAFTVRVLGYDNYGRLLTEVWRAPDGSNLSDALIASGNAVVMKLAAQLDTP